MSPILPNIPVGGRLKFFKSEWRKFTSDPEILDMVSGMSLSLDDTPVQTSLPHEIRMNSLETAAASDHIQTLLQKRAIRPCSFNKQTDFLSNIFLTPKHDGGFRMILNLKKFNKYVHYAHFKMESLNNILDLVTPNCYMAVLDLTDAYLTVPIGKYYIKFLKFCFQGKYYCYVCLPFGISSAPRKFTKLLKPIVAHLRTLGIVLIIYIDDVWVTAASFSLCLSHVLQTARTLTKVGFLLNRKKSRPEPSHRVVALGYIIDSQSMTVSLPEKKILDVISHCTALLNDSFTTIRSVACVIGKIVSTFPALPLARAHYRFLEHDKIRALRLSAFDYDAVCFISSEARKDLQWIINKVPYAYADINRPSPNVELFVDAAKYGWGAQCLSLSSQGFFSVLEMQESINTKETLAAFYAVKAFMPWFSSGDHILIRSDNTTAVSTISKMGTMSNQLRNKASVDLWSLINSNNMWISVSHVPGVQNVDADLQSRSLTKYTEWSLPKYTFQHICSCLGHPDIDLFASRLNNQVSVFCSRIPDPMSTFVDAFTLDWSLFDLPYAFPPFILI